MRLILLFLLSFSVNALTVEEEIGILTSFVFEPTEHNNKIYNAIRARHNFIEGLKEKGINRYLIVNREQYTLRVIDNKKEIINERVIVGRPTRKTPLIDSMITHVIFNPSFNPVPNGKVEMDIINRLKNATVQTQGPFIKGMGYRFKLNGSIIPPDKIDWNNIPSNLRIYQLPGPHNALGKIKFFIPNKYYVFIHDTPNKHLFDRIRREFSSGCIRMENPHELSKYLLGNDTKNHERYDNNWVKVTNPLPVYIHGGIGWNTWIDKNKQITTK